ncbi:LOW QUALITY PROTEIN: methylosome subunit pICln-like [Diabrotica undecimpunctata]|uniref:LOW QUALITY PROTEIN: methylosome subunit pICln-like n=1 Tax=Diabrotica undecimpunctata TaxID=50387 RepID=UPI003B640854
MVIFNSFKHPESPIRYQQEDVQVYLDKKDLGLGTLFVSESTLCWQQEENTGFSIEYSSIPLHAISKDLNVHSTECVYLLTDGYITMPADSPPVIHEDDDSPPKISEILYVPRNTESIPQIYEAIKVCQELNPDPMDEVGENELSDDNDDNLYEDAEDDLEGEYNIGERGGGDADVDDLSRRILRNNLNIQTNYTNDTTEEDDF